jgi:hypothetical protein
MDKGLWSFGTLFIGSVAHFVGTPNAIAIFGASCALAASAFLYQVGQARINQPAGAVNQGVAAPLLRRPLD